MVQVNYELNKVLIGMGSDLNKALNKNLSGKTFDEVFYSTGTLTVLWELVNTVKEVFRDKKVPSSVANSLRDSVNHILILEDHKEFIINNPELGLIVFCRVKDCEGYDIKQDVKCLYAGIYAKNDFDDKPFNTYNFMVTTPELQPFVNGLATKDKLIVEEQYELTFGGASKYLSNVYPTVVESYRKSTEYRKLLHESVKRLISSDKLRKDAFSDDKAIMEKVSTTPMRVVSPFIFSLHLSIYQSQASGVFKGRDFSLGEDSNLIVLASLVSLGSTQSKKAILYKEKTGLWEILVSLDDLKIIHYKYMDELVYQNVSKAKHNMSNMLINTYQTGVVELFKGNPEGLHLGTLKSDVEIESKITQFLTTSVVKTFPSTSEETREELGKNYNAYIEDDKEKQLLITDKAVNKGETLFEAVLVLPKMNIKCLLKIVKREYYSVTLKNASPVR